MSLSDSRPNTQSVTRTKLPIKSTAFQLLAKTGKKVQEDTVRFTVFFMVLLTGLGEMTLRRFSPWWYLVLITLIAIDFYETNIKKPIEVTSADPAKKLKINLND